MDHVLVSPANYSSGGALADSGPAAPRLVDPRAIEEILQLLGRAVRQLHTYPPSSPLCIEAIDACVRALAAVDGEQQLHVRVHPAALLLDETPIGTGTVIEQEVAARLHRAGVAAVTFERDCTARDILRFCLDLLSAAEPRHAGEVLADRLIEQGIEKIAVQMAPRPAVLPVPDVSAPVCDTIERERARREAGFASGARVGYLYPPGKGWARVDPASSLRAVSITDLALLAEDPAALALMLMQLTDEELPQEDARKQALEQKFSDIATLFSSLGPQLARTMFAKLAQAVLDLEPERRHLLLRRTILPGLLDGGVDGAVLREFPDVELADALCLLLDLETAAPEVLDAALDRLELPAERRASVEPLLEQRIRGTRGAEATGRGAAEEYARRLVNVGSTQPKSYGEFAAFDLSLDAQALDARAELVRGIAATDVVAERLRCLTHLIRLEPNPVHAERFVDQAWRLIEQLEAVARWTEVAAWLQTQRVLAGQLMEDRPDVAVVLEEGVSRFCTRKRALAVLSLRQDQRTEPLAEAMLDAAGVAFAPAFVEILRHPSERSSQALLAVLCQRAVDFAPVAVTWLEHPEPAVVRAAVRTLGFAGAGHERLLGTVLRTGDEGTAREALRALARIGTGHAAMVVATQVREARGVIGIAAEEALWRFPPAEARRQVRELLGRRDFVTRHPDAAARLLDRAAQAGSAGLEPALAALAPFRFHFWNPGLVRVARKARTLVGS